MKFNWGYKILAVYSIFVAGILFLVFKSSQQKNELVQKDYYADELKYQNVINASQNAKDAGGALTTVKKDGQLLVILPLIFHNKQAKGVAHLYYAADESRDISKIFSTNNGAFEIELLTKINGYYRLKLDLEANGKQYYYDQKIIFKK
jgi:hypothetical protein